MSHSPRKSVADMISVFSNDNAKPQPNLRHKPIAEQSKNIKKDDVTTIAPSTAVDESDPRYQRTLKHFNSIGRSVGGSAPASPKATVKPQKEVVVPEKSQGGGVYYRRTSLASSTDSTTSLPSSPSQESIGVKPSSRSGSTVKRSQSFTSHVSVDVTTPTRERKRSSIVFSVNPSPPTPRSKPTATHDDGQRLSVKDRVKMFSSNCESPPTLKRTPKVLTQPTPVPPKCSPSAPSKCGSHSPPKCSSYSPPKRSPHSPLKSSPHSPPKCSPHSPPKRSPHSPPKCSPSAPSTSSSSAPSKVNVKPTRTLCKVESPLFIPKEAPVAVGTVKSHIQLFNQSIISQPSLSSTSSSDDSSDEESSTHSLDEIATEEIPTPSIDEVPAHTLDEVPAHSLDEVPDQEENLEASVTSEDVFDPPMDDLSLESSPIYSYHQYTLKHKKSRSSSSGGSVVIGHAPNATEPSGTLEIIPENESSGMTHMTSSSSSIKQQVPNSSDDSERELVRKMSSVSLTFYQEVLDTISKTIGPPTDTEDQTENISKVVDEIIRNSNPGRAQVEADDENVYETIEEYSRKVSDYVIRYRDRERRLSTQTMESSPPQLPPRPSHLLKEQQEVCILSETPTDQVNDDMMLRSSPTKKRNRRSLKTPERNVEIEEGMFERRNTTGSGLGVKKKKKYRRPFFKSKVEPKEYEDSVVSITQPDPPVSDHRNTIQPINTSESEGEDITRPQTHDHRHPLPDHTVTPDSGVFSEIQGRYVRNPLTPPLFTKLGINGSPRNKSSIRFSSSDPSLHTTLLKNVPDSSSMSHLSVESDISELTPSISSFESGRYTSDLMKSPAPMRKRVRSDASSDRPTNSSGTIQKNYLLNVALIRRRRNSLPGKTIDSDSNIIEVPLVHADCIMDRPTTEPGELSFTVNDVIAVLDMTDNDWWQGMVEDRVGWFPASWVRLRIGQDDNTSVDTLNEGEDTVFNNNQRLPNDTVPVPPPTTTNEECEVENTTTQDTSQYNKRKLSRRMTFTKRSVSDFPHKLSSVEIRAKCIEEILSTEREYVQHLKDIVEGFLKPCEEHSKLFTPEIIEAVFSNIKEIYEFQQHFLNELSQRIDSTKLNESQIGEVFVKMGDHFCIYSEYCNNHPNAVNEMKLLKADPQYTFFFESCRLLRNLTDISLEGFLLTPVQRICRYPLQLTELVKHTPDDHPDHTHVVNARNVMTQVAMVINERKRRMESVCTISKWQESVDNWKGHDVLDRSSVMVHSGELHKISKGHSQERHFFLFDHQLIYCKKDAIGGKLSYKGRVDTDKCSVCDISDGEITHNTSGIKNAWKMTNVDKDNKVYILYAKTSAIKQQWMNAFAKERSMVSEDMEKGFVLSNKMKRTALATSMSAANTQRRKSLSKKSQHVIIDTSLNGSSDVSVAQLKSSTVDRSGKGVIGSPNEFRKRFASSGKKTKL